VHGAQRSLVDLADGALGDGLDDDMLGGALVAARALRPPGLEILGADGETRSWLDSGDDDLAPLLLGCVDTAASRTDGLPVRPLAVARDRST
jgi:hypothetical protein